MFRQVLKVISRILFGVFVAVAAAVQGGLIYAMGYGFYHMATASESEALEFKQKLAAELRMERVRWCRQPGMMSYWRSPMPEEYKYFVRAHVVGALRDGCFDGHIWSHGEILAAIPPS